MVLAFMCISFGGAQLICSLYNHLLHEFELGSASRISGIFFVQSMFSFPLDPTVPLCRLTGFGALEQEDDERTCRIQSYVGFLLVFLMWL